MNLLYRWRKRAEIAFDASESRQLPAICMDHILPKLIDSKGFITRSASQSDANIYDDFQRNSDSMRYLVSIPFRRLQSPNRRR